jgi:hypothetical protein
MGELPVGALDDWISYRLAIYISSYYKIKYFPRTPKSPRAQSRCRMDPTSTQSIPIGKIINYPTLINLKLIKAILKVFVVPPRSCDIPVLPMKLPKDPRLLFPLCAKCAQEHPEGGVKEHYKCQHSRRERGWVRYFQYPTLGI